MPEPIRTIPRVVILGGGFGGLWAARTLRGAPVHVTLIDRRNFHLFQALLYQVATGGLSPANIAAPLRAILKRQRNVQVLLGEVTGFDVQNRQVILADGAVPYDLLIVAAGGRHHYFGHDEWEPLAPGLKTIEEATEIRRRVLMAFERAERADDPEEAQHWLSFAVIGAGPTGVELAGALGEIANFTLHQNFRRIDPSRARIYLIEGADRVLPSYPPKLSENAARALAKLGVTVRTQRLVTDIQPDAVYVRHAGQGDPVERIPVRTVLWAAGVQASPLGQALADATGVSLDRMGRVIVQPDLSILGYPEIFVIGDMAHFSHQPSGRGDAAGAAQPLPGIAPVAIQQAKYAARLIALRARGDVRAAEAFQYVHLGTMATIGRAAAVADLPWLRLTGLLGWLAWLFVHLMRLVAFHNRVLVLIQWAGNYFTRNRAARLITGLPSVSDQPVNDQPVRHQQVSQEAGELVRSR